MFPATRLPVQVQIAPGADLTMPAETWPWVDITSLVRLADNEIRIVRGRPDEARQSDPGKCIMRLDNTGGHFTPSNPAGQWYGLIGRNTPIRVRIVRVQDTFTRTLSGGWGAPDSTQLTALNANPRFEAGTSPWQAQSATIARSTARAHEGAASLLITPDGVAASGGAIAERAPVVAGRAYLASMWVYSPGGWSDLRPAVDWWTAPSGGSFISTSLGSAFVVPAGAWTYLAVVYTAPAGAGAAQIRARHGGTPAAGNVWYVDEAQLAESTVDQVWITSGGSPVDYYTNGSRGVIDLASVNVTREVQLAVSMSTVDILIEHISATTAPTGANVVIGVRARYVDANNFVSARVFLLTDNSVTVNLWTRSGGIDTLTAYPVVPAVGTTTFLSLWMQAAGSTLRVKVWESGQPPPTAWNLSTTTTHLAAGGVRINGIRNTGNTNVAPYPIRVDNVLIASDRFTGFVSAWPPRWDRTGKYPTVPIEANGILRRLGQGKQPVLSALRRAISAAGALAYWPCEDGTAAAQIGSAIPGHSALSISGGTVEFKNVSDYSFGGVVTTVYGTSSLPDLKAGAVLSGSVPSSVATPTASGWMVHLLAKVSPLDISGDVVLAEWRCAAGTWTRWQLKVTKTSRTQVIAYTPTNVATTIIDRASAGTTFSTFAVSARQNGGNIDVGLWLGGNTPSNTASVAGTLAGVSGTISANTTGTASSGEMPVGHIAVFAYSGTVPYPMDASVDGYGVNVHEAARSHRYEAAVDRLARLCAERGVPLTIVGTSSTAVTRMGPQPVATWADLVAECIEAEQGVLYEDGWGLGYRPRKLRYGRTAALALDFAAGGPIAEAPEPTDDDQGLVNRWTVKRRSGSEASVQDDASIAAHGEYEAEVEVNHVDDTQLASHATLRLRLSTAAGLRWPRLALQWAAKPDLIDAWLAAGLQSRITAANPPEQVGAASLDLVIEGWEETLGHRTWEAVLNTSPHAPWLQTPEI